MGFPGSSAGRESACNVGDLGSVAGLERSPGEGKGNPLQYSGLENSTDRIVHGVAKGRTGLSDFHCVPLGAGAQPSARKSPLPTPVPPTHTPAPHCTSQPAQGRTGWPQAPSSAKKQHFLPFPRLPPRSPPLTPGSVSEFHRPLGETQMGPIFLKLQTPSEMAFKLTLGPADRPSFPCW